MTIKEAIEDIISKKDDSLLIDLKKFMSYLRDLIPEHNKELKILQNGLTERILELFFNDNRPQKNRIALIKMELEDQGLSEKWINFIVESFCSALVWEIENTDDVAETITKEEVTENNFDVNKEVDLEEAKRQLELAQKQLEKAQKSKINEAHSKTKEAEEKFEKSKRESNLLKLHFEDTEKREKELKAKYDKIITENSETKKDLEETKSLLENLESKIRRK